MASTASFFSSTLPLQPQSHNNWTNQKPNRKPYKNLHFLSNQTPSSTSSTSMNTPFSSSSSSSTSVSFPLNIIRSNTTPIHFYPLQDSTDCGFVENHANLSIPTAQNHQLTHQESRPRLFIQDPPWISSLFLKGLYKITLKPVKLEHKEIEKHKYNMLRRRQIKEETEAWERMVNEYRELEREMCEKKLAPDLPYVKSLFLGWFEPLREAIEREQRLQRAKSKKVRAAYAPHIDLLPAEKMAVIVMHKMMGLIMAAHEDGCVQVVQAAVHIGQAIEQEVSHYLNVRIL